MINRINLDQYNERLVHEPQLIPAFGGEYSISPDGVVRDVNRQETLPIRNTSVNGVCVPAVSIIVPSKGLLHFPIAVLLATTFRNYKLDIPDLLKVNILYKNGDVKDFSLHNITPVLSEVVHYHRGDNFKTYVGTPIPSFTRYDYIDGRWLVDRFTGEMIKINATGLISLHSDTLECAVKVRLEFIHALMLGEYPADVDRREPHIGYGSTTHWCEIKNNTRATSNRVVAYHVPTETMHSFNSVREAADKLGIKYNSVYYSIKRANLGMSNSGWVFKAENDPRDITDYEVSILELIKLYGVHIESMIDTLDHKTFTNLNKLAEHLGVGYSKVYYAARFPKEAGHLVKGYRVYVSVGNDIRVFG